MELVNETPIEQLNLTHSWVALYQELNQTEGTLTSTLLLERPDWGKEGSRRLMQFSQSIPATQIQQPYSSYLSFLRYELPKRLADDAKLAFPFEIEFNLLSTQKGLAYRYRFESEEDLSKALKQFQSEGKTFEHLQHQSVQDWAGVLLYLAQPGTLGDYLSRDALLMAFSSDLLAYWLELEAEFPLWTSSLLDLVILLDSPSKWLTMSENSSSQLLLDALLTGIPLSLIHEILG